MIKSAGGQYKWNSLWRAKMVEGILAKQGKEAFENLEENDSGFFASSSGKVVDATRTLIQFAVDFQPCLHLECARIARTCPSG